MVKINVFTPETDFYNLFLKNIEGQDIKTYKTFVIPLDNNKLNILMCNDSVPQKNIACDDLGNKEAPKDSESSSDKKKLAKEKFVAPISGKYIIPK